MLSFLISCSFFTMLVNIENAKLKLAFAIPIGAPITVADAAIEILPLDKTIKDSSE